jgi:hypothetical protein
MRDGTDESLSALARKYRALAAWRRQKERDGTEPERAALRALASEFPGALREIEVLSLATLEARAEALEARAKDGAAPEPWMLYVSAFHRWMRAALYVKARAKAVARDAVAAQRVADECAARTGAAVDESFVRAALSPDNGRLRPLALARVASEFCQEPAVVAHIVLQREASIDRGNSALYEDHAIPARC